VRLRSVLVVAALVAAGPLAAARASSSGAGARAATPTPEPSFATPLLPSPCGAESGDPYEKAIFAGEGWKGPDYVRYPGACQRLHFAFGPISVKPGQNDVLIQPITIEKPAYDGYITRMRANLVLSDGTVPPIEQIHLHHGTWLSLTTAYGEGPFFAAGEEKTYGDIPRGYGMPVKGTDQWQLLYMVHSAVPQPTAVYITYDIDYVAKDKAESYPVNLRPVYPIWLDVRNGNDYPVFNVQRAYGTNGVCTWPAQRCADFDPWGRRSPGQGEAPGNTGQDYRLPARGHPLGAVRSFQGGTLVAIGGHLHPGGLYDAIDLVRHGQARRIFTSEAKYWSRTDHAKLGGPPNSWDFSMTLTGLPRWGVHVQPGDTLRIDAAYDTRLQATYEDMGIAVAYLAPDVAAGRPTAPGVDPFTAPLDPSPTCASGGVAKGALCDKGVLTHGHLPEAGDYGGPSPDRLTPKRGSTVSQVQIAGFTYVQGDLSTVSMTGIPVVKLGQRLTFVNEDAGADVYHTVTTCRYPCLGATGVAFPTADGRTSLGRLLDLDSAELGFGPPIGPARNQADWTIDVLSSLGYRPGEVVTYFCRVHPFMRGAFEVGP
jgi:hypothetical protein